MKDKRCFICNLIKPKFCFNFTQKVCDECLQLKKEDKKMEKSATEIYKELAEKVGSLIPSDQVLARIWGMTNSAASGARKNLRYIGYEFEQLADGQWEVTRLSDDTPSVTHYHATEDGIYKIHHERVEDLPKHVSFRGRNSIRKWLELEKLLESMEIGEVQRVHFTNFKLAVQGQGALYNYSKGEKKPFTVASTVDPQSAGTSEYWLYFRKVAKDPSRWGENAGKRRRAKLH